MDSYDEAFDFTKKYIRRWYDFMAYTHVDYDDYAQNCAVSFFTNKKNNWCHYLHNTDRICKLITTKNKDNRFCKHKKSYNRRNCKHT